MKKFICLMLVIVLTFSFSACGEKKNQGEETTTTAPASEFPLVELADAYASENGAVYEDCVNKIKSQRVKYTVKVCTVEGATDLSCKAAYVNTYLFSKAIEVGYVDLNTRHAQTELLKTLKAGDEIEFEGVLDFVSVTARSYNGFRMAFRFNDVIIKSVNGNAV